MKDLNESEPSEKLQLSLAEQRTELQLRLQLNRRLLVYKFSGEETNNHFPRSKTMRLLTNQNTLNILKKFAFTAIGVKTLTSIQYGYSLWRMFNHKK